MPLPAPQKLRIYFIADVTAGQRSLLNTLADYRYQRPPAMAPFVVERAINIISPK